MINISDDLIYHLSMAINGYHMSIIYPFTKSSGWWFQPTPLKNHGVRRLEL